MSNENVAILDVRSYEITFLIGSKGVNGTFVFRDSRSEVYDGYSEEGFLNKESFRRAIISAVTSVRQNYQGTIKEIYVGAPSAFTDIRTKGHTASFSSKRKITSQEVEALYESGLNDLMATGRYVRCSDMYFTLGDNRKYFKTEDLHGISTSYLKGALCYYFATEDFYNLTENILMELGFTEIHYIPETLAEATYLLPEKEREGYAFLLDIGFLSTSVSVIYGNGIVHEESFDYGVGSILIELMQNLNVEYSTAEAILANANIAGGVVGKEVTWTDGQDNRYSVKLINDIIKFSLDELCEKVDKFFDTYYRDKDSMSFATNPLSITGEGADRIKGVSEHIEKRLNKMTKIVKPELPYYDKPQYSSRIALLSMALSDKKKDSWIQRVIGLFGGKNNV